MKKHEGWGGTVEVLGKNPEVVKAVEEEVKKVVTLPLAPGEEDNAKYVLRDGTRTGCKVLAERDMPTEADLFRD
jgi:hypothetical protein